MSGPDMSSPEYDAVSSEDVSSVEPLAAAAERASNAAFWLYYLFLRPKVFFRHFVIEPVPLLTAVAAWMMGVAEAADRLATPELPGGIRAEEVMEDWGRYWGFCAVLGIVFGALYFSIGGWWYRVRLEFSGATHADKALARRVYLFAAQVYVIPVLLYTLWQTKTYGSPAAAMIGEDVGGVIVLMFLLWSVYASYRGVRTAFEVRRWSARIWFVVLPVVFYFTLIFGVALAYAFQEGVFDDRPRLENPTEVNRPGYSFRHPSNWDFFASGDDEDLDYRFQIEPLWADAAVFFTIYDAPIEPQAELEATLGGMGQEFVAAAKTGIDRWGHYSGVGYELSVTSGGTEYRALVFATTFESTAFEVLEMCDAEVCETLQPGFRLVRNTFNLKNH